jgi:hypothetical protein
MTLAYNRRRKKRRRAAFRAELILDALTPTKTRAKG